MEILEITGILPFKHDEYGKLLFKFDDGSELQIHGNELYLLEKKPEIDKFKVTKYELVKVWEEKPAQD